MRPLHSDPPGQEVFFDCFHISLMEIKVNQCYFSASVSFYAGEFTPLRANACATQYKILMLFKVGINDLKMSHNDIIMQLLSRRCRLCSKCGRGGKTLAPCATFYHYCPIVRPLLSYWPMQIKLVILYITLTTNNNA